MPDKNKFAPMWVKHETKDTVRSMKVHKNQSYDEVVNMLIAKAEAYDRALVNDTDDGR